MLRREGRTLATYGVNSGPQGYRPLREFLAGKLKADAGIACTADDILITSGSLQALDLVNAHAARARRHRHHRGGLLPGHDQPADPARRQHRRHPARPRRHADGRALERARRAQAQGRAAEIHLHHPDRAEPDRAPSCPWSGARRCCGSSAAHGVPIFEDDCYADLIWSGERPPAIYAMSERGGVIHIGSFSKSIAPALRVGYIVAPWDVMSRMLALKTDGGSGALEQMVLAEYCTRHFSKHVPDAAAGPARQARDADGIAARALRDGGGVRRSQGRHLPLGQAPRRRRHDEALRAGARGGRRDQPGAAVVGEQGRTAAAGCGCASRARATRKSTRASRRWPKSAAASSGSPHPAPGPDARDSVASARPRISPGDVRPRAPGWRISSKLLSAGANRPPAHNPETCMTPRLRYAATSRWLHWLTAAAGRRDHPGRDLDRVFRACR